MQMNQYQKSVLPIPPPPPSLATSTSTSTSSPSLSLCLPVDQLRTLAELWLREDCPSFDAAAVCAGDEFRTATLYAKSPLLVCGIPFFNAVFNLLSPCTVTWNVNDGEMITSSKLSTNNGKMILGFVHGPTNLILRGERVALNVLAECSAVGTIAKQAVDSISQNHNHNIIVAGTRKTTPGLRLVQKYAMIIAGADPHRFDLSTMIMIKDNHIQAAGNIQQAIKSVKRIGGFTLKIDVEAESEQQAIEACEAGADIVMLDNFTPDKLAIVAKNVKARFPNVIVEASGGVNLETLPKFCVPGVDVISFSINRHVRPVDMSLKLNPLP